MWLLNIVTLSEVLLVSDEICKSAQQARQKNILNTLPSDKLQEQTKTYDNVNHLKIIASLPPQNVPFVLFIYRQKT